MEITYEEAPSPRERKSRKEFFAQLKKNIIHCNQQEYEEKTQEAIGVVPLSGISIHIKIVRKPGPKFEPIGYFDAQIFVNDDYYSKNFRKDYSGMLPYDLEHEMWEAYYSTKKGYNPDALDLKEGEQERYFGRAHHLAIRKALRKAHKDGKLDEYLDWIGVQFKTFQILGDTKATEELAYCRKEAEKIRRKKET